MASYDSKPSAFAEVGDGTLRYRFDIVEIVPTSVEGEVQQTERTSQWQCEEVIVKYPFTANNVLEAVIAHVIPATREQKLVNDYNAAKLGLLGGSTTSNEAKEKIASYKEFLETRALLKQQVDADCAEYGLK